MFEINYRWNTEHYAEDRIAMIIKGYMRDQEHPVVDDYETKIMLRNGNIVDISDYRAMIKTNKVNPSNAYVYIRINWTRSEATIRYPFLFYPALFFNAYLTKLGFYSAEYPVAPASGIKYVSIAVQCESYLKVEVSDLDTVANNLNLPMIVDKIVSGEKEIKELTKEVRDEIYGKFVHQELFAGRDFYDTWNILYGYYDNGWKSVFSEATDIISDYNKIFKPYKLCFNRKTWSQVDCSAIKFSE